MKKKGIYRTIIILVIIMLSVSCDQISKSVVRKHIQYNERIDALDDHLMLTKVENTGAFLGVGKEIPRPVFILLMVILPGIALGYAIYYLLFKNNLSVLLIIGLSIIVGGGIGNIYDRIVHGSVTDFLHIDFVIFRTGIFNLADVSVMIGTFLLLYNFYFKRKIIKVESPDI